ncbi:alcohol dehydrogenase catalytic domain-containing protein [Vallitaleaceae bacterium 9-2]
MSEKMKAVVAYGPEDYKVESVDIPKAGFEEVIIKIGACGICGSDMKAYHGASMFWGGENPWMKAPVIPGHEFFGTVVELGEGAAEKYDIQIGDRIITDQIKPCGKCRFCQSGQYWMCEVHDMYGFQGGIADGGMAEYMKIYNVSKIYKIPKELSLEEASIIEPLACAVHTVQRATIEYEDVVVLAGAGTLGLCMVQLIRLKTPKTLIVLDVSDERLAMAKKLGADITINPQKTDAISEVKALTQGYGCDVYIEATGSPIGVTQGLEMIRKLGRFVEFSVFGKETTTDWSVIGDRKELDIRGSHLGPYTYPVAIDLLKRKLVTADDIVAAQYPLEAFTEAFELALSGSVIKVLLVP